MAKNILRPYSLTMIVLFITSCGTPEFHDGDSLLANTPRKTVAKEDIKRNGSFKVWTTPANPKPQQSYDLWISVDYGGWHASIKAN